jgi:hypothetical protein
MGERDAVSYKSGQPVHQSGPGLKGPTLSPTSGRKPEARPPLQPKTGRGLGQSPRGCEAARSSLLDSIETNRNIPRRGKHCGRFTVRGYDHKTARVDFYRVNCKCWNCSYCSPRKAKRYRRAIRLVAEECGLCRFITLTLDPSKIEGDPIRYLNDTFAKLRTYLRRQFGSTPRYIRVLEFQKNGNPHFHLLIDRYVPWDWLREAWQAVGGGSFVNIKFVDVHRISNYLSKYLTKELLLSAPPRCRRVTTSRGIHLFEKQKSEKQWSLIERPIWVLCKLHMHCLQSSKLDSESVLTSFSINSGDEKLAKRRPDGKMKFIDQSPSHFPENVGNCAEGNIE